MADMAALIAQAKAEAATLYGQAVSDTLAQNQQIEQSYAAAAASGVNDAAARQGSDQAYLSQKSSEMRRGADAQGLKSGGGANAGAESASGLFGAEYGANADLWKGFFDTTKGTALGRNQAAADSFSNANNVQQTQYDKALAEAIASAYGSGGGGRGGGRGGSGGYEDEEVWTPPELTGMTDGLVRGMVASQRRYEGQAAREAQNPTNSASGGRKKTTLRRGSGGSF